MWLWIPWIGLGAVVVALAGLFWLGTRSRP